MIATPGIADEQLLERAVRGARKGRGYHARWACVMELFGVGSTFAANLCIRFGLNPDEQVKR